MTEAALRPTIPAPGQTTPAPRLAPSDFLVTKALVALDKLLPDSQPPLHFYVVGGYALQLAKVRSNPNDLTDVDYIGEPLSPEVRSLVNEIGLRFGLGPGWLNNDLLLTGTDSIKDIEFLTGPLHFVDYHIPELRHITISAADAESVLRMKLISIDTSLISYLDQAELAARLNQSALPLYTRLRDFTDVALICEKLGWGRADLIRLITEMNRDGYLLAPKETSAAALAALSTTDLAVILEAAAQVVHGDSAQAVR
ncbi:MAG: hypothetical protein FWG25_10025 [Promicromonosporaceae bacterium]|nr:hypothetical protein [Promicromonosporaceae bacterium]